MRQERKHPKKSKGKQIKELTISLAPLDFETAIRAAMATGKPPPAPKPKRKKKRKAKK